MTVLNIDAVSRAYKGTIWYCDDSTALDFEGNPIEIDQTLIDAALVEINWERLRKNRDLLIAETDWWATSDRTMTAEQTAYRQALRDLPANTTDPANPVWPTKP
jgi:hypothetical protein